MSKVVGFMGDAIRYSRGMEEGPDFHSIMVSQLVLSSEYQSHSKSSKYSTVGQ